VFLEVKFHRHLNQPGSGRADNVSEIRIVDLPAHRGRTIELRMVEDIEGLDADVESAHFRDAYGLAELHIEVLNAGTVKHAPGRVPQYPRRFRSEQAVVESRLAVARIRIGLERT